MRSASSTSPPSYPNTLARMGGTGHTSSGTGGDSMLHQAPIRGRPLVINSSIHLLQTFLFFYHRHPAVLICWTIGQQAFNAAMIIILDAWETGNIQNMWLVNEALAVFKELQDNGVHKIAALAISRISEGIVRIEYRQRQRQEAAAAAVAGNTAAMSRHPSQQQHHHPSQRQDALQTSSPTPSYQLYQPNLALDSTATNLLDIAGDTVMGNTGMFLLEDPGLQSQNPATQLFAPWGLSLPASAAASSPYSSSATSPIATNTSGQYSPPVPHSIPVSNVPVAPFPAMSPPFQPPMIPMLASPFSVGLQPRMPTGGRGQQQGQQQFEPPKVDATPNQQQQQQQYHHQTMPAPQQQQQHHTQSTPQHPSRHGYSPYQAQAARRGGAGQAQGQGHRLDRPTSARSRSGRSR